LREGLTITSFEHLSQAIEISPTRLAEVTSIAQRTLARRKRGGRLHLVESERVFRLGALFDKAMAVLGNETQARRWFKTPQKALGGKSPLEYSDTEIGSREVEDLLGRLEHGVFS
jgi:putative toxin-antitoxin system antitoxin component (TIGR02293 family)